MPPEEKSSIDVELTDESEAHCLKLIFRAKNVDQPLEIFLHTTQAIHLVQKLSLKICELHHRDSEMLLRMKEAEKERKERLAERWS
jgi:hypothetical protein